ncbi:unnamed protein product, partial [Iphiclides podalirius]
MGLSLTPRFLAIANLPCAIETTGLTEPLPADVRISKREAATKRANEQSPFETSIRVDTNLRRRKRPAGSEAATGLGNEIGPALCRRSVSLVPLYRIELTCRDLCAASGQMADSRSNPNIAIASNTLAMVSKNKLCAAPASNTPRFPGKLEPSRRRRHGARHPPKRCRERSPRTGAERPPPHATSAFGHTTTRPLGNSRQTALTSGLMEQITYNCQRL